MDEKIDKAIEYYTFQSKQILDKVNSNGELTVDQIISYGEKLKTLEYKITALGVAKEN